MSRMVVGSKPFSRKSLSAEVRMFSRGASRLLIFSGLGMFERVQNIGEAEQSPAHLPRRTWRITGEDQIHHTKDTKWARSKRKVLRVKRLALRMTIGVVIGD